MDEELVNSISLAAVGALRRPVAIPDLPIAYVPRVPDGRTYQELLERAVGWGRR